MLLLSGYSAGPAPCRLRLMPAAPTAVKAGWWVGGATVGEQGMHFCLPTSFNAPSTCL